jgi:FMN-dependent NADH-azoreductase
VATLLAVNTSPRFDISVSRALTAEFIRQWRTEYPGDGLVVRDLPKTHLPFVDLPWIGGAFSPPEDHAPDHSAAISISNDLVAELQAADHIVIGTPMYNFSIPALLKAYFDQIIRVGLTVSSGYEGMLTGKSATVILATGGDFRPGSPYAAANMASRYIVQLLGFIGITDVQVVLAACTRAVDEGQITLGEFVSDHEGALLTAVARRQAVPA